MLVGLPRAFWDAKMELIGGGDEKHLGRRAALAYLDGFCDRIERGEGLIFVGPYGVGKSSAAACLLKEAARWGFSARYVCATEIQELSMKRSDEDDTRSIESLSSVDVLLVDDLGKEYRGASGYSEKNLFALLQHRHQKGLATFVTTNFGTDGIEKTYGAAFAEMIVALCVPISFQGENTRRRKSGERAKKFMAEAEKAPPLRVLRQALEG